MLTQQNDQIFYFHRVGPVRERLLSQVKGVKFVTNFKTKQQCLTRPAKAATLRPQNKLQETQKGPSNVTKNSRVNSTKCIQQFEEAWGWKMREVKVQIASGLYILMKLIC